MLIQNTTKLVQMMSEDFALNSPSYAGANDLIMKTAVINCNYPVISS